MAKGDALAAYERVIQLEPAHACAYHCKGEALFKLKRYKEALAACEYAIFLNPKHAPPLMVQAQVFQALGDRKAVNATWVLVSKLKRSQDPCR